MLVHNSWMTNFILTLMSLDGYFEKFVERLTTSKHLISLFSLVVFHVYHFNINHLLSYAKVMITVINVINFSGGWNVVKPTQVMGQAGVLFHQSFKCLKSTFHGRLESWWFWAALRQLMLPWSKRHCSAQETAVGCLCIWTMLRESGCEGEQWLVRRGFDFQCLFWVTISHHVVVRSFE